MSQYNFGQDLRKKASPIFAGLVLTGLTSTKVIQTDTNKALTSVSDLTSWIAGTSNQIAVADDSDGTVTLSTPQDIHTGASPVFAGLTVINAINEFSKDGTLADNSDSAIPTEKAIKTYIDAEIAAVEVASAGDIPTTNDSDSNTMLKAHAYLAQTSGYVNAHIVSATGQQNIWVGSTNDPVGAGILVSAHNGAEGGGVNGMAFVPGGKYFEIVIATGTPSIIWTPLVTGGAAPIDQD